MQLPPDQTFFDVDRSGYCYLLRVKYSFNKKGELVETIMQVTHLGKLTKREYLLNYVGYVVWHRCFESQDFNKLGTV